MRAQSPMPNDFWIFARCAKSGGRSKWTAANGRGTYVMEVEAGGPGAPGGTLSRISAPRNGGSSEAPCAAASGHAAPDALKYVSSNMEAPAAALVVPGVSPLLLRPLRAATAAVITQICHTAAEKCNSPVFLDLLQRVYIVIQHIHLDILPPHANTTI